MDKQYKLDVPGRKEFMLPSGKRIDFLDRERGIIYELKPHNPRSIRLGNNQLKQYTSELKELPEFELIDNWKTVLETY